MWDKFIGEQIRRANRNLLITNVAMLLVPAVFMVVQHKVILGTLRGGEKVQVAALATATPDERTVIDVTAEDVVPTGYGMVKHKSSGSEEVEYEYLAMKAGNRFVIVKAETDNRGPQFTGTLKPLPNHVSAALLRELKSPEARTAMMPIMLDTMGYKRDTYLLLGFGIPAILLAIWNLKKWMARAADPATSPVFTQLQHRGGMMACQQIDSEVAQSSGKIGKAILTRSWVIAPSTFGASIMHLDDVVWVYKKVTQHRVNFIPTGKTYSAMLCASTGRMVQVDDKQDKIDELLGSIAIKAPWAIVGFSDDIQKLWDKNRDALLQAVNQRRSELSKKMAATASAAPVMA